MQPPSWLEDCVPASLLGLLHEGLSQQVPVLMRLPLPPSHSWHLSLPVSLLLSSPQLEEKASGPADLQSRLAKAHLQARSRGCCLSTLSVSGVRSLSGTSPQTFISCLPTGHHVPSARGRPRQRWPFFVTQPEEGLGPLLLHPQWPHDQP